MVGSWSTGTDTAPSLSLCRADSGAIGTYSPTIGNADVLGNVRFNGSDGTKFIEGAKITASADGTWGTDDGPTKLVFSTTADGASSPTERMRIDSSGRVGIGTSPITSLHVNSGTTDLASVIESSDANVFLAFKDGNTTGNQKVQIGAVTDDLVAYAGGSERARIDSSGRLGLGTSTPGTGTSTNGNQLVIANAGSAASRGGLSIYNGNAGLGSIYFADTDSATVGAIQYDHSNNSLNIRVNDGNHATIDSSGRLGIGTTSPGQTLHVNAASGDVTGRFSATSAAGTNSVVGFIAGTSGTAALQFGDSGSSDIGQIRYENSNDSMVFNVNGSNRVTIDSSGRLLVGTSSSSAAASSVMQGNSSGPQFGGTLILARGSASIADGTAMGILNFSDSGHVAAAQINATRDGGTWTSGSSQPTRLVFSTTADGANNPTERMRIESNGNVLIGTDSYTVAALSSAGSGFRVSNSGIILQVASNAQQAAAFNRTGTDGLVIGIRHNGTEEGSISTSGTTVSYNGAHLSRWSQLPGGAVREEILRGTVLSNIDEMCEWGDEDNEQLNRMKVSDVEGDKNVAGVFQAWDDDDDTYTNDFYCAMTGDFVIRIAQGVTVERGDLLMSAGDGTAKPQDDDIIRSKTIAKVTSTHVSETYADGSYCVPCVLMAC
jgi:hypothetical protein